MARGVRGSVENTARNITKAEREARIEAEKLVVANPDKKSTPKASPLLTADERKIFNKLKRRNKNFTESDSENLNMLAQYLTMWARIKVAYNELDIDDERALDYERRMIALDKQISAHTKDLCLPLSQRFKLATEMAKVMVEERKLEQMNNENQPKEINPLLAVLEATKNAK